MPKGVPGSQGPCLGAEVGCTRLSYAQGYCNPHYRQVIMRGKPLKPLVVRRDTRFRNQFGHKQCRTCKSWLGESKFYSNPKTLDRLMGECKTCSSIRSRGNRYGLTRERLQEMFDGQGGRCAICPHRLDDGFAVDHDHDCCATDYTCGKCVRGLLCQQCNHGIGNFRDDIELLENAMSYLKEYQHQ